jgi:hypothetical protein
MLLKGTINVVDRDVSCVLTWLCGKEDFKRRREKSLSAFFYQVLGLVVFCERS